MAKKTDGRTIRGAVRRQAWADLAAVADEEAMRPNPTVDRFLGMDGDTEMQALYLSTRKEILRWMNARARGEMRSPPGGVGGHK